MSESYSYELTGFRAGWVFILEPYSTVLDDPDWHPYLLLTDCLPAGQHGVLAFGSGQETEARHGSPSATIQPRIGGRNDNALEKPTHFYPAILVQQAHDELPRPTETVRRGNRLRPRAARVSNQELGSVKALLRDAMGLGTGTAAHPSAHPGSWRGRVVPLSDDYYDETGVRFALVLTAHRYSAAEHYQVLVPIIPGDGKQAASSVVRTTGQSWIQVLGPHVRTALLVVPALESVWHHSHIQLSEDDHARPVFIDQDTLDSVETQVALLFGI
jgi:hypothetical protein